MNVGCLSQLASASVTDAGALEKEENFAVQFIF